MLNVLRIELLVVAVAIFFVVFRAINQGRLLIRIALQWILYSFTLVIVAVFPQIILKVSSSFGIKDLGNTIWITGILPLAMIGLNQAIELSACTERIKRLTQEVSLQAKRKDTTDGFTEKD